MNQKFDESYKPDYEHLNFPGLDLDQNKIAHAYDEAIEHATYLLAGLFGRVAIKSASTELPYYLSNVLARFAERVASEISSKYVDEALHNARETTSNMFEALAVGALATNRANGEQAEDIARGFAVIAAIEGRPTVLNTLNDEKSEP